MAESYEITSEEIQAHAGFVRALARQLLRDEALVEDVVQETWIRALKDGPRRREALTAWLRTVTRNVAFKAMRGSRRRKRREHVAARGEATSSTADLVEREHSLRTVVDAVLTLPEHYRTVVMLRYFDDLPPRTIAVQLELPVGTVRMRLHRALKLLRGDLRSEYGGDEGSCKRGLALLAGMPLPGARPTGTLLAAGAVLVAAGAVAGVWVLARAEPGASPDGREARALAADAHVDTAHAPELAGDDARAAREELAALDADPEGAEPTGERALPSSTASARAEIWVVDTSGAPVSGATVFGEWGKPGMLDCGRTGAGGHLSLAVPADRVAEARSGGLPFLFGGRAEGHAPSPLAAWEGGDEPIVLTLRRGGATLSGRVLGADGQPLAGARVEVGESYRVGLTFRGEQVLTGGSGPGRLVPTQLTREPGAIAVQSWRHARGYLGPQVLGDGRAGRAPPAFPVYTDENGEWVATGLEPGPQPIRVTARGHAPSVLTLELGPGEVRELDIALEPEARLSGTVRRADGLSLERAIVYVVGDEPSSRRSTRADAEGRFALSGLAPGRVRVFAESRTGERATHSAVGERVLESGREASWDAVLERHAVVLGRVENSSGRPLADWRLEIRLDQNVSRPVAITRSDLAGNFAFEACPPFPSSLYVYPPGKLEVPPVQVVPALAAGPERLVVRLAPEATLTSSFSGRLLGPDGEPPRANTHVLLVSDARHVVAVPTDDEGLFSGAGVPAGRYRLVVSNHALGWLRSASVELSDGLDHELGTLRLPQPGRLRIAASTGEVDSTRVRVTLLGDDGFEVVVFDGRASLPVVSDAAPGRYRIDAPGSGAAPVTVSVHAGSTARGRLVLQR